MTVKSRKEMLTKVFEHFCNDEPEAAGDLLHQYIIESAREIHSNMISEDALETDMEADLAKDLQEIQPEEGDHEDAALEVDAEETLAKDMLGDDSEIEADAEVDAEIDADDEEAGEEKEEGEADAEEGEEEVEDRIEDLEAEFEELKKAFEDLSDEEGEEEVKESTEMTKVAGEGAEIINKRKVGEVGAGDSGIGIEADAKSPFSKVNPQIKLGGEAVEIGKGEKHVGFDRETAPTSKEMGKFTNKAESAKNVMQKVAKPAAKGEVGSGKSGIPVEANTKSVL